MAWVCFTRGLRPTPIPQVSLRSRAGKQEGSEGGGRSSGFEVQDPLLSLLEVPSATRGLRVPAVEGMVSPSCGPPKVKEVSTCVGVGSQLSWPSTSPLTGAVYPVPGPWMQGPPAHPALPCPSPHDRSYAGFPQFWKVPPLSPPRAFALVGPTFSLTYSSPFRSPLPRRHLPSACQPVATSTSPRVCGFYSGTSYPRALAQALAGCFRASLTSPCLSFPMCKLGTTRLPPPGGCCKE